MRVEPSSERARTLIGSQTEGTQGDDPATCCRSGHGPFGTRVSGGPTRPDPEEGFTMTQYLPSVHLTLPRLCACPTPSGISSVKAAEDPTARTCDIVAGEK
jgi:hypothetical protein